MNKLTIKLLTIDSSIEKHEYILNGNMKEVREMVSGLLQEYQCNRMDIIVLSSKIEAI